MPVKLHVTSSLLPQKKFTKKRRKTMNRNRQTFYDTRTWRSTEDNIRCDFSGMFLPLCEAPCGATLVICKMWQISLALALALTVWVAVSPSLFLYYLCLRAILLSIFSRLRVGILVLVICPGFEVKSTLCAQRMLMLVNIFIEFATLTGGGGLKATIKPTNRII